MSANRSLRCAGGVVATCAFVITAFVGACSSGNSNPTPPVYTVDGDASTTTDATSGQSDATGTTTPDAGSPPEAGDSSPEASLDASPLDAAACTADSGCWTCTPTTALQFLNQCTASTCVPFDNLARLPNYDGGALPPLQ